MLDALWGTDTEKLLAEGQAGEMGWELDVVCVFGGGPEHKRTDERVLAGTDHLRFEVTPGHAGTGIQVGYAVHAPGADGYEITWLDPVFTDPQIFTVPVAEDEIEAPNGTVEWSFHHRINPGQDELCYTGASYGPASIHIYAVRG